MPSFATWRSDSGDPYPQGVVFERAGRHHAIASGGGGGSAQLLPRNQLEVLLDRAWRGAAVGFTTAEHLRLFMAGAEAGIEQLRQDDRWRGTTAHLIGAWWDPGDATVWLSGVGNTEAYLVRGSRMAVVHRETTLANLVPEQANDRSGMLVALLGAWSEQAAPARFSVERGDRIVLASCVGVSGDDFMAKLRELTSSEASPAELPRRLWDALRDRACAHAGANAIGASMRFDRQAVVGVLSL